jgi:predicted extracellular nuclease
MKRSAQAVEARMMVDHLMDAEPHRLIIVAGDFNAADYETPLKILVGAEEDTGNGRLGARSLVVLDRSLPEDRRFSVLHHGRPEMLDHILVSRPLLAHFRSIEVHNETLSDEVVGYGKTKHQTASYHAPLVAEFSIS